MLSGTEHRTLLETLQSLYSRIALSAVGRRLKSYRRHVDAGGIHDLSAPLAEQIKRLAASANENSRETSPDGSVPGSQTISPEASLPRQRDNSEDRVINNTVKELSNHFKQSHSGSALNPELGEKLRNSTWNHMHAALRLARQGQESTATIHADIANHALREAAHYLSEEEYARFIAEVEEELKVIRGQESA